MRTNTKSSRYWLDTVLANQHETMNRRFDALERRLAELQADVNSLLESRSFQRGVWSAATAAGALASGIVTLGLMWLGIK
jgi:hypothetical protein